MEANKVIKYVGISLAVLLIINIFIVIISLITGLTDVLDNDKKEVSTKFSEKFETTESNDKIFSIDNIDIELGASKLIFKTTENEIKVDTNNEYIEVKQDKNKLKIKEKRHLFNNKNVETIVYVPLGMGFNEIDIEMGAGTFEAEEINATKVEMDLGAGKTIIDDLSALNADIETGAGLLTIKSSDINYLDLDLGVGEVNITGSISNGDIDAGVGNLNLNLKSLNYIYKFIINKGVGNVTIDDENVSNGEYGYGSDHVFKIDGGVGSINVNTK